MSNTNGNDIRDDVRDVVLVVDDDAISRRLMSIMLKNMGFRAIGVEDGDNLIFSCEYFSNVKAILMDMNMPKLDGYKTTRKIRNLFKQKSNTDYIPIIAVTVDENSEKCIKAGCDIHLLKPVGKEALAESLQSVGLNPVANSTR